MILRAVDLFCGTKSVEIPNEIPRNLPKFFPSEKWNGWKDPFLGASCSTSGFALSSLETTPKKLEKP